MVWETESAAVPQSFALIAGCSRLGDGFVLLAEGPEDEAYGLLFFDRDGKNMEIRSIHARGYAIAMACKQDTIHILLQAPADAGGAFFVLAVRRTGGQDAKKTVTTSADIVLSDLFAVGQNYLLSGSRYFGNKPPEAALVLKRFKEEKTHIQDIAAVKEITPCQTFLKEDRSVMLLGMNAGEDGQGDGRILCNTYSFLPQPVSPAAEAACLALQVPAAPCRAAFFLPPVFPAPGSASPPLSGAPANGPILPAWHLLPFSARF